jgi:mannosyl-3-phosphoglycerate phosphatase
MSKPQRNARPPAHAEPPFLIFTDLDGTLLDEATYSFEAAEEALALLRMRKVPVILVSSKTRAEMESLRAHLHNTDPFIVENGGGLFIPTGYFESLVEGGQTRDNYHVIELGAPYARLRTALKEVGQAVGYRLRGFGDMSEQEISERTGLTRQDAALAKQREYDEPFIIENGEEPGGVPNDIRREAEACGLRCTRGGRFLHLMGNSDKGRACRLLGDYYRRQEGRAGHAFMTVGLGDSLNDLPMLAAVDRPILVQRPDGSYDPEVRLEKVGYAPGIGPAGWNRAILSLLKAG